MRLCTCSVGTTRTLPSWRGCRRLSLLTLESRDVPAAWYTVHLDSAPQGTVGSTAASITSGNLHVDSAYDPSNTGTSFTDAAAADIAAKLAANQLAFEKASIAGFVRLAAHEVKYNDLKAGAGATKTFAYLYREHSGKLELKMLKLPNPNPTPK